MVGGGGGIMLRQCMPERAHCINDVSAAFRECTSFSVRVCVCVRSAPLCRICETRWALSMVCTGRRYWAAFASCAAG